MAMPLAMHHLLVPKTCVLTTSGCALRRRDYEPRLRSYALKLRCCGHRLPNCKQRTTNYGQRLRNYVLRTKSPPLALNSQNLPGCGLLPFFLKAIFRMVATIQGKRNTWLSAGNRAISVMSGLFMTTMDRFPSYTQHLAIVRLLAHLPFPVVFFAPALLIFLSILVSCCRMRGKVPEKNRLYIFYKPRGKVIRH